MEIGNGSSNLRGSRNVRAQIAIAWVKYKYRAWNVKVTNACPFKGGTAYLLGPTLAEGQETPAIGGIPFVVEEKGRARIVPQLSQEWFAIMRASRPFEDKSNHGNT